MLAGDVPGTHVRPVLDDPGLLTARGSLLDGRVIDGRYRENRVAVAERDGELIGIAMSGPPLDAGAWARQLYVLYVRAAEHGMGAGPTLLEIVVDPEGVGDAVGGRPEPSRSSVLPQATRLSLDPWIG